MDAQFGPFRVLARIGRGGMGETFVAERVGPAGVVHRECLKRILARDCERPDWIASFQSEARIAAGLSHQNIVSLRDFGKDLGVWWQSLELVEGTDLGKIIEGFRGSPQRLSLEMILHIAAELAKALAYAHARRNPDGSLMGLVHRDVTPSNILVSQRGEVRLTDFGIAKVTESERTRTDQMKGKAPYISPEYALGYAVDGRADLFALGVVLFELLTGERPYDGANATQTLMSSSQGIRQRDLRALAPKTPEAVVDIVERLTMADREKRFQTADEVWDAVTQWAISANQIRLLGTIVRACAPRKHIPEDGLLTPVDVAELTGAVTR
jgi:serine/threonine protein kinase